MTQADFENRPSKAYLKRLINDIKPDDSLIQLTGYATQVNKSDEFFLDDKSGKIQIREIPDDIEKIHENEIYRVLGEIAYDPTGTQYIKAKFITEMKGLDFQLFQKIENLRKKNP